MSDRDAFERTLASLYDAMLDDTHWPATSALIDEACGSDGQCARDRRRAEGRLSRCLRHRALPARAAPHGSGARVL